jgi:hypothetical protein
MHFKDFVPRYVQSNATFLGVDITQASFESFDACVDAARAWIAENQVDLINVETVVLPNIYEPNEQGTTDSDLATSDQLSTHWYQFLRVWYR